MFPAGISSDVYGTATFTDLKSLKSNSGKYGGGIGLNAFFTKKVGIGLEANSQTPNAGKFLDEVNAKAILRLPIAILAPNVFGGGGWSFERDNPDLFGGGGVSLKVWKNTSAFGDARYVYVPESDKGYPMVRLGLGFKW